MRPSGAATVPLPQQPKASKQLSGLVLGTSALPQSSPRKCSKGLSGSLTSSTQASPRIHGQGVGGSKPTSPQASPRKSLKGLSLSLSQLQLSSTSSRTATSRSELSSSRLQPLSTSRSTVACLGDLVQQGYVSRGNLMRELEALHGLVLDVASVAGTAMLPGSCSPRHKAGRDSADKPNFALPQTLGGDTGVAGPTLLAGEGATQVGKLPDRVDPPHSVGHYTPQGLAAAHMLEELQQFSKLCCSAIEHTTSLITSMEEIVTATETLPKAGHRSQPDFFSPRIVRRAEHPMNRSGALHRQMVIRLDGNRALCREAQGLGQRALRHTRAFVGSAFAPSAEACMPPGLPFGYRGRGASSPETASNGPSGAEVGLALVPSRLSPREPTHRQPRAARGGRESPNLGAGRVRLRTHA